MCSQKKTEVFLGDLKSQRKEWKTNKIGEHRHVLDGWVRRRERLSKCSATLQEEHIGASSITRTIYYEFEQAEEAILPISIITFS